MKVLEKHYSNSFQTPLPRLGYYESQTCFVLLLTAFFLNLPDLCASSGKEGGLHAALPRAPPPSLQAQRPIAPSPQLLGRRPHLSIGGSRQAFRLGAAWREPCTHLQYLGSQHRALRVDSPTPGTRAGQGRAGLDGKKAAEDRDWGWGSLTWERVACSIFPAGFSLRPARGHPGWRCPEHAARTEFAVEQRTEYGRGDRAAPRALRSLAPPRATRPHPASPPAVPASWPARERAQSARSLHSGECGRARASPHRAGQRWSRPPRFARETRAGATRVSQLPGPGPLSRAAPASGASGPEFQEGLAEAMELVLFCC